MGLLREWVRNFVIARHKPRHWVIRPDTYDRRAFRSVYIQNEYRLPAKLSADDVILDIGANVGAFALAALSRGVGLVVCCEPCPENFAILQRNLAPHGSRVRLISRAIWRSDRAAGALAMHNPVGPRNTGAIQVCEADPADSGSISAMSFDDLVNEYTANGRRLRMVKMDCEGSEWPILLTSRTLARIDTIAGEYHLCALSEIFRVKGIGDFSTEVLRTFLTQAGFQVKIEPTTDNPFPVGLFFAER
jgi:FkbM family methyltransferase